MNRSARNPHREAPAASASTAASRANPSFFLSGVTRIHPLSFQRQRSRPNALAVSGGAGFFVEKRLVPRPAFPSTPSPPPRSEEHTSELQSLMRTSYAAFRLNKKKKKKNSQ